MFLDQRSVLDLYLEGDNMKSWLYFTCHVTVMLVYMNLILFSKKRDE